MMTNEELAVLAQQGDREAAGTLWEKVKRLLYQMARRFYLRYGADCCAQRGHYGRLRARVFSGPHGRC